MDSSSMMKTNSVIMLEMFHHHAAHRNAKLILRPGKEYFNWKNSILTRKLDFRVQKWHRYSKIIFRKNWILTRKLHFLIKKFQKFKNSKIDFLQKIMKNHFCKKSFILRLVLFRNKIFHFGIVLVCFFRFQASKITLLVAEAHFLSQTHPAMKKQLKIAPFMREIS